MVICMKNDIYNLVGKNIKKYRKQNNLTQRQLADKLLLSESFIAKLESKTHQTVSLDTLEQIAYVLKIEIKDLFDKE